MQVIKSENSVKKLRHIQRDVDRHWVGDGFPVRTLFTYSSLGPAISPFRSLIMPGLWNFRRLKNVSALVNIPIADSRR